MDNAHNHLVEWVADRQCSGNSTGQWIERDPYDILTPKRATT